MAPPAAMAQQGEEIPSRPSEWYEEQYMNSQHGKGMALKLQGASAQKGALVDEEEDEPLIGTWLYGGKSKPARYCISRSQTGQLRVDEQLATGVNIWGILQPSGQWLQAGLMSAEGKRLGTMRLRFVKDQDQVLSNIKSNSSTKWGRDIHATRSADASTQAPENKVETNAAMEMLSKFFDKIESEKGPDTSQPATTPSRALVPVPPAGPIVPVPPAVMVCAETAVVAQTPGDPLAPFGCLVNRLAPAGGNVGGMVCTAQTAAGAPLLALPLAACWTQSSANSEFPELRGILGKALLRNPKSDLLQSDSTWIALHLLQQKRLGARANPLRLAHIDLLPSAFETSLAWSSRDFAGLCGSRWQEAAKKWQAQVEEDFKKLASELGEAGVAELGLSAEDYAWARQVIQQYGVHVAAPEGKTMELIVPGLELFELEDEAPAAGADGVRVEFGMGALILYATRDFAQGDPVALSHSGLACANGFRLLGRGKTLESNPWDYVELMLKLPVERQHASPSGEFWPVLTGLERHLKGDEQPPRPGTCLPPDRAQPPPPVRVVEGRSGPEVHVRVRFTRDQPLPDRYVLVHLGVVILAHPDRMSKIMREEIGVVNPFGPEACEQRALAYINKRVQWALEEYPSRPDADIKKLMAAHGAQQGLPPRRVRGLRMVAEEKQILAATARVIQERLGEPLALPERPMGDDRGTLYADLFALSPGEEPTPYSDLSGTLAQLRGMARSLEQVGQRFQDLVAAKKLDDAAGKAVSDELEVLQKVLEASPLGSPLVASPTPSDATTDVIVQAQGVVATTAFNASRAASAWAIARIEQEVAAQRPDAKKRLSDALVKAANECMARADYEAACADLSRLFPEPSEVVLKTARDCAARLAARSGRVLAGDALQGRGQALQELRRKLGDLGYMAAARLWPRLPRHPPVHDLALSLQRAWEEAGSEDALAAVGPTTRSLATTGGPLTININGSETRPRFREIAGARKNLKAIVDLFLLHRSLPLSTLVEVLGKDACSLLLACSALSCYAAKEAKPLEPEEAARLVSKPPDVDVIANMALLPVDDDVLVAVDFEQGVCVQNQFEPVMYLAADSCALMATTQGAAADRVLDVSCGGGAQGFVALKRYAKNVTFLDPNPRALRFVRFGALLNGVEERCTFVEGCAGEPQLPQAAQGPFDAVLASLPHLPNPDGLLSGKGPAYARGGVDGSHVLAGLMGKASKLVIPGGWIAATSLASDAEGLAQRVRMWIDSPSLRGLVLRGKSAHMGEFVHAATEGCTELQQAAYTRGLCRNGGVRSVSQALVLLWPQPTSRPGALGRVQLHAERERLWSDDAYLSLHGGRALATFRVAVEASGEEEPLYAFDWGEGEAAGEEAGELVATGAEAAILPSQPSKLKAAPKEPRAKSDHAVYDGATWSDIEKVREFGFAPPVLCNVLWMPAPAKLVGEEKLLPKLYNTKAPNTPFNVALLEILGCPTPQVVKDALVKGGCKDRIQFERGNLSLHRNAVASVGMGIGVPVTTSEHDVLVLSLVGWRGSWLRPSLCDLSNEVMALLQAVMTVASKKGSRPTRVVLLTCGSSGPAFDNYSGYGGAVSPAAPVLGIVRTARREVPQVPIVWLDTDAILVEGGEELMMQMGFELNLSTPMTGFWEGSPQQKAMALLASNRDVAYRVQQRWVPRVTQSALMPIYDARKVPPLPSAVAGAAIVVTGGTGGVGLTAAEALVESGAQALVLTSRTGELDDDAKQRVSAMQDAGVSVAIERCDTGRSRDVQRLLERVRASFGSPQIIVHASGLVDDKPLRGQDPASMQKVFVPKAEGAWHLHQATIDDNLYAFVMFSSVAALRGSEGQANYAAANAYLDELAHLRVAQGLPALSVQWPHLDLTGSVQAVATGKEVSIGVSTVKQVVKLAVSGGATASPVQAVLPAGHLVPSSPMASSLLEPLLAPSRAAKETNKISN